MDKEKPPAMQEVSELEFAMESLIYIINFAMRNGLTLTEAFRFYGSFGEEQRIRTEELFMKNIQTVITEINSQRDIQIANPKEYAQFVQWKIPL